jgi:hypothetical protein
MSPRQNGPSVQFEKPIGRMDRLIWMVGFNLVLNLVLLLLIH